MAQLQHVELAITNDTGHKVGCLTVRLLPRTRVKGVWPLVDERADAHRDASLEPVQLLESQEYVYEVCFDASVEKMETNQPAMMFPDDDEGMRGRLRTGLYTGAVRVTFFAAGVEIGSAAFEVRSRKVDYMSQYRWMLRDIAAGTTELIMQSFAPAAQRFSPDDTADAATLYQRFAFIKSMVMDEALDNAITHIAHRPHREWVETREMRHPGQPIPPSSAVARQIARPGPRLQSAPGAGLIPYALPRQFEVVRTRETLDTEPNRFVRFALQQWHHLVEDIGTALGPDDKKTASNKETRARREIQSVLDRLDHYITLTDFAELSPLTRFPAGNMVLLRAEGYRDVMQMYLQFELAARLAWDGGDTVYEAGQRNIAVLYEYWVYFRLVQLVAGLAGVTLDVGTLLESSDDGLALRLKQGCRRVVHGVVKRLGRTLKLEFWFNRRFEAKANGGAWTRAMQPDFSLRIVPEEAGADYADTWVHFDAKYRIDTLGQLFGTNDEADAAAEDEDGDAGDGSGDGISGRVLREDLLKMHAYRDAIRRTSGAYVIYPGTEREIAPEYHEILPGLGAFCLRPTDTDGADGEDDIAKFIHHVLDHVASQVTQHERKRYWTQRAYRDDVPRGAAPAASFITKPPADTPVLLGYVKNEAHLAWVEQSGRYNLRADGRTGSVGLHGAELGAELVILYGPPLAKPGLWQVVAGPQVMTRGRMLAANYPKPRGGLYVCLPVEPIDAGVWDGRLVATHIEALRLAVAPDAVVGAPVVTTWQRVVEGIG